MSKTGKIAQPTGYVAHYKVPAGPRLYVPVKKAINERSLARRARYEKLFAARGWGACDCPCHDAQVDECFCTPACIRGEPEGP